mgnify:CR=1 FL=1
MGAGFSLSKILGLTCLDDCVKYVLNDCHVHSQCSDCCEFDCETDPIELEHEDDSIDIGISKDGMNLHA